MNYKEFLEDVYGIESKEFANETVSLPVGIIEALKDDFTPGDDKLNFAEHLGDLIIYGLWKYNNLKIKR